MLRGVTGKPATTPVPRLEQEFDGGVDFEGGDGALVGGLPDRWIHALEGTFISIDPGTDTGGGAATDRLRK